MGIKIYWASRLVSSIPGINHHYALIVWEREPPTVQLLSKARGDWSYLTLGGHPSNPGNPLTTNLGNLVFKLNEEGDEASARQVVTVLQNGSRWALGYSQYKEVAPPTGDAAAFAQTLTQKASYYEQYSRQNAIPYAMLGPNSNSWCNALFEAAGVDGESRRRLRDFTGRDQAAEMAIEKRYFGG